MFDQQTRPRLCPLVFQKKITIVKFIFINIKYSLLPVGSHSGALNYYFSFGNHNQIIHGINCCTFLVLLLCLARVILLYVTAKSYGALDQNQVLLRSGKLHLSVDLHHCTCAYCYISPPRLIRAADMPYLRLDR